MKTHLVRLVPISLVMFVSSVAGAQEAAPTPPTEAPPAAVVSADAPGAVPEPATGPGVPNAPASPGGPAAPRAPSAQTAATPNAGGPLPPLPQPTPQLAAAPVASPAVPVQEVAPPQSQWTYSYPTGQWVYTTDYGWIWVPNGSVPTVSEGTPYVYLYAPSYGWHWYYSPWGLGPYRYGAWVTRPWHPVGWHGGWATAPHVVVHAGGYPHPAVVRPGVRVGVGVHTGGGGFHTGGGFRGGFHGGHR